MYSILIGNKKLSLRIFFSLPHKSLKILLVVPQNSKLIQNALYGRTTRKYIKEWCVFKFRSKRNYFATLLVFQSFLKRKAMSMRTKVCFVVLGSFFTFFLDINESVSKLYTSFYGTCFSLLLFHDQFEQIDHIISTVFLVFIVPWFLP